MKKKFLQLVVLFGLASCQAGDRVAGGTDPSAEIDQLYEIFSTAYETLDAELVGNLYVDDARYLPGDPGQGILHGRDKITDTFSRYFQWAESTRRHLDISFRIVSREVSDSLAYDVGYYLIRSKPEAEEAFSEGGNAGKFVTVMELQKDGSWKFQLDGFSPAPYDAFHNDQPE